MAIKRYTANKDNTITTAFKSGMSQTGKLSNMGASDVLEIYSVYGQATTSSIEKTRILVQFPITEITANRTSNLIPASSSVQFNLNLFNVKHGNTIPKNFTISAIPILESWREGLGLDMEEFSDLDTCNWQYRDTGLSWATEGASIPIKQEMNSATIPVEFNQTFDTGLEDLSINVTPIIEEYIKSQESSYFSAASGSVKFGTVPPVGETLKFRATNGDYRIVQTANTSGSTDKTHLLDVSSNNISTVVGKFKGLFDSSAFNTIFSGAIDGSDPLKVNITQKHKGYYGNTTITKNMASVVVNFSGGAGIQNNGFLIKLSGSFEDGSLKKSYFTKKFSARESEYYFQRPVIEAQWDSRITDDRGKLVTADPKLTNAQNTNNLYYHNYINGKLVDLPSIPKFALTTDKGLSEHVSIVLDNTVYTTSNSEADDLKNAYAEFEMLTLLETSAYDQATGGNSQNTGSGIVIVSYYNPLTLETTSFYFYPIGLKQRNFASRARAMRHIQRHPQAYPAYSPDGMENIVKTAESLVETMNRHPGFSNLFRAINYGFNKIRIYTRVVGGNNHGWNSSVTLHRTADASGNPITTSLQPPKFFGDFGSFNASNTHDTLTTKTDPTNGGDIITYLKSLPLSGSVFDSDPDVKWPLPKAALDLQIIKRNFRGNSSEAVSGVDVTCVKQSTGVYKASFIISNNIAQDTLYEKWTIPTGSNSKALDSNTGNIRGFGGNSPVKVKSYRDIYSGESVNIDKIASIQNLKPSYKSGEKSQLNVTIKNKLSNPNVYSKVTGYASPDYFDNVYYQIKRVADDLVIVPFSTGSAVNFSGLGYNERGCNFLLDTSYLQQRYLYEISFCCIHGDQKSILNEKFRFRVE